MVVRAELILATSMITIRWRFEGCQRVASGAMRIINWIKLHLNMGMDLQVMLHMNTGMELQDMLHINMGMELQDMLQQHG